MTNTHIIDPIHGSIEVSELERLIIDSPPFQRLRKIKQLGNVHLVFPGATHTRFSHSLGVMHLAGRLFDALVRKNESIGKSEEGIRIRKRIRLAALMHDIGHGPFSHQFEQFLKSKKFKRSDLSTELQIPLNWKTEEGKSDSELSHEDFSFGIIKHLFESLDIEKNHGLAGQDLCCLLDDEINPSEFFVADLQKISTLIGVKDSNEIRLCFKSILSGEIDADRLDYLQRDSLFCGSKITGIDTEHILNSIDLKCDSEKNAYIDLNPNAVGAVEQILISRKLMFDQVYTHHVNAAFDSMLVELMSKFLTINKSLSYSWYVGLTDEVVEKEIQKNISTDTVSPSDIDLMAKLFLTRTTLKKVFSKVYDKRDVDERKYEIAQTLDVEKNNRKLIEFKMKDFTKLDRDKKEEDSSIIKVASEHKGLKAKSINLVSEIFGSNLWRCDYIKIVVFEGMKKSAQLRNLESKLKIAHLTVRSIQTDHEDHDEVKSKTQ